MLKDGVLCFDIVTGGDDQSKGILETILLPMMLPIRLPSSAPFKKCTQQEGQCRVKLEEYWRSCPKREHNGDNDWERDGEREGEHDVSN